MNGEMDLKEIKAWFHEKEKRITFGGAKRIRILIAALESARADLAGWKARAEKLAACCRHVLDSDMAEQEWDADRLRAALEDEACASPASSTGGAR